MTTLVFCTLVVVPEAGTMDVVTCTGNGDIKLYLSTVGPTGRGDPGTMGTKIGTLFSFATYNDDCDDLASGPITSPTSTTDFVAAGRGGVIVSATQCPCASTYFKFTYFSSSGPRGGSPSLGGGRRALGH